MLRPSIFRENYLDSLFDDFFETPFFRSTGVRTVSAMNTDIREHKEEFEIIMDLPGFAKEDVRAELKEGYLTIRASRAEEKKEEDKEARYLRKERYSGHYQRSFFVGEHITEEDIRAKFKDGTLTIHVPKKEAKPEVEETKIISIEGE